MYRTIFRTSNGGSTEFLKTSIEIHSCSRLCLGARILAPDCEMQGVTVRGTSLLRRYCITTIYLGSLVVRNQSAYESCSFHSHRAQTLRMRNIIPVQVIRLGVMSLDLQSTMPQCLKEKRSAHNMTELWSIKPPDAYLCSVRGPFVNQPKPQKLSSWSGIRRSALSWFTYLGCIWHGG